MARSTHRATRRGNRPKRGNAQRRGGNNTNNHINNSNANVVFFTAVAVVLVALATCLYLALQPELSDTQKHLFGSLLIIVEVGVGIIFGKMMVDRF